MNNTPIENIDKFYSLTQIQNLLGMSHKTVLHYVYEGKLKAHRFNGGTYRVTETDLKDFINEATKD